ncbi:Phage integrase family protein [Thermomonospora echinospora]|uniref:Phage integrase family protein n=1 Tax=Thermomonospora echinospora TaxID=1992 RepID=A0A1H6CR93_9ACTN|nr:hypothetical protein [Thermomonospora echinospora]SEG75549.1 Phage integrase family protein [Thermomonospora echinospora]
MTDRFAQNFRPNRLRALDKPGIKDVRLHDLRHTGNTLAAIADATLPELKQRMGHASDRAAMIYLHATDERHREIADTLSAMAKTELKQARRNQSDTQAEEDPVNDQSPGRERVSDLGFVVGGA